MHDQLFAALHADHEEVLAILSHLQESGNEESRRERMGDLLHSLLPHMVAEEQIVYPALRTKESAWEDAREAIDEHRDAQNALRQMVEDPAVGTEFLAQLKNFREILEEHIRFEEEAIFTDFSRFLSERHAAQVLDGFRREKELARQRYPDLPIVTAGVGQIHQ